MRAVHIAIVEDNEEERALLQAFVNRYGQEKQITFQIFSYETGEAFLRSVPTFIDIVFMDIEFPAGMNGIQTAFQFRETNSNASLIFVTNIKKYAIKGYEVSALNYILKPIRYYSFALTMDRAMRTIDMEKKDPIRVKTSDGDLILASAQILYIEIYKHDVSVHTIDRVYSCYGSLTEWERMLNKAYFVRCNASTLVNLQHVQKVYGEQIEINGKLLRIGRSKKKEFLQSMMEYLEKRS